MRAHGLLSCALSSGHDVLVVCPDEPSRDAPDLGVRVVPVPGHRNRGLWAASKILSRHPLRAPHPSAGNLARARALMSDFAPDVVVVSEVMSWGMARSVTPPGVPVIYDAHNVEQVLYRSIRAHATTAWDHLTFGVDAWRVGRDENDLLATAAGVMAVSDDDAAAFRGLAPHAVVTVVPSSVPFPDVAACPQEAPPDVLFVGSLDYHPNVDAVTELATTLFPAVRAAQPAATLTVVGRGAPTSLRRLASASEGVRLLDDVDDLAPLYRRARCVAIPIRSGGGTKLKAFEAMAYGVPMVCTNATVQGIDVRADEALLADEPDALVTAIVDLLRDAPLAATIGAAARSGFRDRLSWDSVRPRLDDAIDRARLPAVR